MLQNDVRWFGLAEKRTSAMETPGLLSQLTPFDTDQPSRLVVLAFQYGTTQSQQLSITTVFKIPSRPALQKRKRPSTKKWTRARNTSTVPNYLLLKSTPAKTVGAQLGKSQTNLAAEQRELTHEHSRSWTKQKSKTHHQKPNHFTSLATPAKTIIAQFAATLRLTSLQSSVNTNTAGVSQNKEPNTFNSTRHHLSSHSGTTIDAPLRHSSN